MNHENAKRRSRVLEWGVLGFVVFYPVAAYGLVYLPYIVPRLDGWRAVPLPVKVALLFPYVAVVLVCGEFGHWRTVVWKSVVGALALVTWQQAGNTMRLPAVTHPDLTTPGVVMVRLIALSLGYFVLMSIGRAARLHARFTRREY